MDDGMPMWENTYLDINGLSKGLSYGLVNLFSNASGRNVGVPIIAIKGDTGPVLGITAALHGNELNGLPITHKLAEILSNMKLSGTVIMVPVANVPGFESQQRKFIDGVDLNRIMPGVSNGTPSEMYAYRLFTRIISTFDCLLDLHTASFGRVNSHYIRADLTHPHIRIISQLLGADIIVNTLSPENSLRNAAMDKEIAAVTIELGNPATFQDMMVERGIDGILNVMSYYKMIDRKIKKPKKAPIICKTSYWLRTDSGGVLNVYPNLVESIKKDQVIGELFDLHGRVLEQFVSPTDAIVVGKSVNPVSITGSRILHIGIPGDVEISKDPVELDIEEIELNPLIDNKYFDQLSDDSDI